MMIDQHRRYVVIKEYGRTVVVIANCPDGVIVFCGESAWTEYMNWQVKQ